MKKTVTETYNDEGKIIAKTTVFEYDEEEAMGEADEFENSSCDCEFCTTISDIISETEDDEECLDEDCVCDKGEICMACAEDDLDDLIGALSDALMGYGLIACPEELEAGIDYTEILSVAFGFASGVLLSNWFKR